MASGEILLAVGDLLEVSYFKSYAQEGPYRLEVGDSLKVLVSNRPELTHEAVVLPDGFCTLPLLGSVRVRGKTVEEVDADVTGRYAALFEGLERVSFPVTASAPSSVASGEILLAEGDLLEVAYFKSYAQEVPYRLEVGDSLKVLVSNRPELAHEAVILPDGFCTLPLLGSVRVRGKTVEEVDADLTGRYGARFEHPEVDVLLTKSRVRVEDFFSLLLAGPRGPVHEVRVTEEGVVALPLIRRIPVSGRPLAEVRGEIESAYAEAMPEVRTTVVLKSRRTNVIAVLGEVLRPGVFDAPQPMPVMRALALAGGVMDRARLSQVLLVHPEPGDRLVARALNLESALDGTDVAVGATLVSPNDVVYVPKSAIAVDVLLTKSRVRVEDFFSLLVAGPRGPVREVTVTEEGVAALPLIRQIPVMGRSLAEVRGEIESAYGEALPEVRTTVVLKSRRINAIAVLGEVLRPGVFDAPQPMPVMRALALAGGATDRARLSQVLLVHPEPGDRLVARILDLEGALDGTAVAVGAALVSPNDVVYVPRSAIANVDVFVDQYIRQLLPIQIGAGIGYSLGRVR